MDGAYLLLQLSKQRNDGVRKLFSREALHLAPQCLLACHVVSRQDTKLVRTFVTPLCSALVLHSLHAALPG